MNQNPFQPLDCDYAKPTSATQLKYYLLLGAGVLALVGGGLMLEWQDKLALDGAYFISRLPLLVGLPIPILGAICSVFSFRYTKVVLLQAASVNLAFLNIMQVFAFGLSRF